MEKELAPEEILLASSLIGQVRLSASRKIGVGTSPQEVFLRSLRPGGWTGSVRRLRAVWNSKEGFEALSPWSRCLMARLLLRDDFVCAVVDAEERSSWRKAKDLVDANQGFWEGVEGLGQDELAPLARLLASDAPRGAALGVRALHSAFPRLSGALAEALAENSAGLDAFARAGDPSFGWGSRGETNLIRLGIGDVSAFETARAALGRGQSEFLSKLAEGWSKDDPLRSPMARVSWLRAVDGEGERLIDALGDAAKLAAVEGLSPAGAIGLKGALLRGIAEALGSTPNPASFGQAAGRVFAAAARASDAEVALGGGSGIRLKSGSALRYVMRTFAGALATSSDDVAKALAPCAAACAGAATNKAAKLREAAELWASASCGVARPDGLWEAVEPVFAALLEGSSVADIWGCASDHKSSALEKARKKAARMRWPTARGWALSRLEAEELEIGCGRLGDALGQSRDLRLPDPEPMARLARLLAELGDEGPARLERIIDDLMADPKIAGRLDAEAQVRSKTKSQGPAPRRL